ncbi:4704_t:CDS:2 [Entrophospora sp. SA101]|nr:4704_t:CDS:2 [Entrophospora sp. SA101]
MSTELYNKIYNFLVNAEDKKINAISIVYLGMKEDRWIAQNELKAIVKRAVGSASDEFMEGSPQQLRIFRILPQFDNAFEGVNNLYDMGAIKTDKEEPFGSDQIENNINKLKDKLKKESTPLYRKLYSAVDALSINEMTWKDPLASQVISDKSELVNRLNVNLKKAFQKPARQMKPDSIPKIRKMCKEFISSFVNRTYQDIVPEKLIHNGSWKESEEKLSNIVKEAFVVLEDIWINPVFNYDLAKSLNEGTYQSTVVFLSIRAILKNLPFRLSSFIISDENIVTNFIETLLLLRNILITNVSLLCHGSISLSKRLMEESTTVSTPRD